LFLLFSLNGLSSTKVWVGLPEGERRGDLRSCYFSRYRYSTYGNQLPGSIEGQLLATGFRHLNETNSHIASLAARTHLINSNNFQAQREVLRYQQSLEFPCQVSAYRCEDPRALSDVLFRRVGSAGFSTRTLYNTIFTPLLASFTVDLICPTTHRIKAFLAQDYSRRFYTRHCGRVT